MSIISLFKKKPIKITTKTKTKNNKSLIYYDIFVLYFIFVSIFCYFIFAWMKSRWFAWPHNLHLNFNLHSFTIFGTFKTFSATQILLKLSVGLKPVHRLQVCIYLIYKNEKKKKNSEFLCGTHQCPPTRAYSTGCGSRQDRITSKWVLDTTCSHL